MFSSTATPEEKIADAELLLVAAQEVGPKFVESGKIKQEELDAGVLLLEVGVKSLKAALLTDDPVAKAEARAAMMKAFIHLTALLAA